MAPCMIHLFGTDRLGRDLLVRCMIGCRISLLVGVVSAIIVLVIGSVYGAISGLVGGKTDTIMMRIVDIVYSVPEILLIVVIKLVIDAPLGNLVNNVAFFKPLQRIGSATLDAGPVSKGASQEAVPCPTLSPLSVSVASSVCGGIRSSRWPARR